MMCCVCNQYIFFQEFKDLEICIQFCQKWPNSQILISLAVFLIDNSYKNETEKYFFVFFWYSSFIFPSASVCKK